MRLGGREKNTYTHDGFLISPRFIYKFLLKMMVVPAMDEDPRLLIAFCHVIEESATNGFGLLDRESLVAIERALMRLKGQIEDALAHLDEGQKPLN
jgi:hypothetical protein